MNKAVYLSPRDKDTTQTYLESITIANTSTNYINTPIEFHSANLPTQRHKSIERSYYHCRKVPKGF